VGRDLAQNITRIFFISFLLWCVFLAVFNPPPKTTMSHFDIMETKEPFTINGKVTKILSHDKVLWESNDAKFEIYLIGIYVPKSYQQEVNRLLKDKILDRQVGLEFDKQYRDRFGNHYGYLYLDGKMINGMLIELGLARYAVVAPNDRYQSLFLQWELNAKSEGRGMWQGKIRKTKENNLKTKVL